MIRMGPRWEANPSPNWKMRMRSLLHCEQRGGASPKISREKKMVARNSEDRVSRASKLDLV